jgi:hypothetical protein
VKQKYFYYQGSYQVRSQMSRESIEELRERLLRDERVQQMIAIRAFEIYKLRGGAPGREAEDWFQAESEVINLLIEANSPRGAQESVAQESDARPEAQTAEERAESQSELGVWSPAEPASAVRAPAIGAASGSESQAPSPKKSSTAKSSASPRRKTEATPKKTPARRAASKKSDEAAKPKATRRRAAKSEGGEVTE